MKNKNSLTESFCPPIFRLILFTLSALALTGCPAKSSLNTSTLTGANSTATTSTVSAPSGAKAATFIFKQKSAGGSFATAPANGTNVGTGVTAVTGVLATQVYLPNKSTVLEANGVTGTNWPLWIKSLDIGISGSSNTAATDPDCARFSAASTGDSATCTFGSTSSPCGAPADYFRVVDRNCHGGAAAANRGIGTGASTDGVFIRAVFDRSGTYLGPNENILVVLEYAASGYSANSGTALSTCFNGTSSKIRECADSTWEAFLKDSPISSAQPYFLVTPPFFGFVNPTLGTGGAAVSTRQFILPLASSPSVTTFQISRTGMSTTLAKPDGSFDATFDTTCASNSAYCLGTIFYSITFYRI